MQQFCNSFKYSVVTICFFLATAPSFAQFVFNEKSQLVEVPKPPVREGKEYTISVTSNQKKNLANLTSVEQNIRQSADLIATGDVGKMDRLNLELAKLYSFFINTRLSCTNRYIDILRERYGILKDSSKILELIDKEIRKKIRLEGNPSKQRIADSLTFIMDSLQKGQKRKATQLELTGIRKKILSLILEPGELAENSCAIETKNLRRIGEIEVKLADLKYRKQFAQKLFYDYTNDVRESLFSTTNDGSGLTFNAYNKNTSGFLPDSIYFLSVFKVNERSMYRTALRDDIYHLSATYTAGKKLSFSINSTDPFKKFLLNWHNKTTGYLTPDMLSTIYKDLEKDTVLKPHELLYEKIKLKESSPEKNAQLDIINKSLSAYDYVWNEDSPIVNYLREWYWYSGGDFKLNYIGAAHKDSITARQKKLAPLQQEETKLKEQISKIESINNCIACRENGLDTLKRMQDTLEVKKSLLSAVQNKMNALKKLLADEQELKKALTTVKQVHHQVTIPVESASGRQSIIYHDAANDLEIKNPYCSKLNNKYILPEEYDVYYGLLNCTKSEGEFTIAEIKEDFNDTAVFTRELSNAIQPLAAAALALTPYAPQLTTLLGTAFGSFPLSGNEGVQDAIEKKSGNDLLEEINYKLWRIALLRKMLEDYFETPTPEELEATAPADTTYFTNAIKAKKWSAPYTNNYTISKESKEITNEQYSIGRQKTIALGAGVFFNAKSARQQTVDTTGNILNVKNSDSKAKFVVGVKVYPFKAFDAEGSLIPRFPEKRFHLFAGFEITKPLENLYAGIGYDIVPGLEISYGAHIYRRDYYSLRNGQVTDKTTSYKVSGAYYGVTIDPIVLVEVLKTFFK